MCSEIKKLLKNIGIEEEEKEILLKESQSIMGKSLLDLSLDEDRKTGLVIGYIQSGKTSSFTAVSCLAKDQGFPLIIVIAGTSTPLFEQTVERFETGLELRNRTDRKWTLFTNPTIENHGEQIERILENWNSDSIPNKEKQSALIIIMKHHSHINNLNKILKSIIMNKYSALIIDDEADQAGLNTKVNSGDISSTNKRIKELRQSLSHHTYLQYTATPQGLLLIELIDELSPEFVKLLTPGRDYIGGPELFKDAKYLRIIPEQEVPTQDNPVEDPPKSLIDALKIFYISVAIAFYKKEIKGNRSMMIHPSRLTEVHGTYKYWVNNIQKSWIKVFKSPPEDPDYKDLITGFKPSYDDLSQTVQDIPSFEKVKSCLERSIRDVSIMEINASQGSTPAINWNSSYSHILVGGQSLDRGFTVKGLTVTYMPRGPGVGNADTIQQRARFYGYKRDYLGYCRVFLEREVATALEDYIEHEASLRNSLSRHIEEGKPLKDWPRVFFLSRDLQPTRRNILKEDCNRGDYRDKWFVQDMPHISPIEDNIKVVKKLMQTFEFEENKGHSERSEHAIHHVSENKSLKDLFENYLVNYKISQENYKYAGLLLQIESFLQDYPKETCTIYLMGGLKIRERAVNDQNKILQLFQGAAPSRPKKTQGTIYPGDREIKSNDKLTIQIHMLDITLNGDRIANNIPALAIWVPRKFKKSWLAQNKQNGII